MGETKKRLFLIDKHTFGCDYKTTEISTCLEPTNVLQIFNLKNKKLLIEASLDDYAVMYFRGDNFLSHLHLGRCGVLIFILLKI